MLSVSAIVVFVLAVTVLFGVRSVQQIRATGNSGWRFPSRAKDRNQWAARILMGPGGFAVGLAAPVADLAGLPGFGIADATWPRVTGLVIAVAATLATFAVQQTMGASWRIGVEKTERTALVNSGAFGFVRNPIFTGLIALVTGLTLAVPNLIAVIGLFAVVAGVELLVRRVEEPYLLATHGDGYRDYAAGT
ncbi:MAG: methyltransferase family protein, partial [Stackebrandtia sp.]